MTMMNWFPDGGARALWAAALVSVLVLVGCSSMPTGEVSLSVAALSAADVDRVEVTITGAGIDPPIVQELARAGAQWRGAIGGIPAGTDRTFTVVAYDAGGTPIYEGTATGVTVVAEDSVTVVIVLQDVEDGPVGMENPPDLHSVTVVPGVLAPGESASVAVHATDPDPGDTLTYAWTGTDGTFGDDTLAATTWTAPTTDGVYTLTITVTDASGSARSVSVDVQVSAANTRGTVQLEVTVNTWPVVTRFAALQGLVASAGTTATVVTATDADGDPVTITYSQECTGGAIDAAGVFTAPMVDPTWAATGSLSFSRAEFSAGMGAVRLADGTVLMAGGHTGGPATDTVDRFDPATGLWSPVAPLATPRRQHALVSLADGRAMAIGGYGNAICTSSSIAATETFDPATGAWSTAASLNELRSWGFGVATLDDGDVLVVGGYRCDGVPPTLSSVERYDATADSWTTVAPIPGRYHHTVTSLHDGRVLVAGGVTPTGTTASAWIYDPGADAWTSTGAMNVARERHTAALLLDGRVLVVGGDGPGGLRAQAEIYDPATGAWQLMESMSVRRRAHTATLLPDGRVVVAGGENETGAVSSSEVFDPATGLWSSPTSLVTGRYAHSAVVLADGRVLLAGGYGNTAEIWSGSRLCTLTATASDGRGGTGTATATVHVTDEIRGNRAPVIDRTFQSNWEAGAGDVVDFNVMAMDPDGDPLRYTWTATTGTLSAPTSASTTWTSAGVNATITIRVSDAAGLWDEAVFTVRAGWLHDAGSPGNDEVIRVAANASSMLVAVRSNGTYDLEGTVLGSGPDYEVNVARLDSSGRVLWARSFGQGNWALGLALDSANNAYVGGYFSGTLDVGGTVLTSAGGADLFVASYGPTGTLRWARRIGASGNEEGAVVAVDSARGRVFVGGQLAAGDPVDLGGGARTIGAPYSGFVVAFASATGAYLWDQAMNGTGGNTVSGLAVDASSGDVVTTATVYGFGSINPGVPYLPYSGGSDAVIFPLSGDAGTLVWPEVVGYTNQWPGHPGVGYVLFSDPQVGADGSIYVAGHFQGGFQRSGAPACGCILGAGGYDTVIVGLSPTGAYRFWNPQQSSGADDLHIALAPDGTLWAAGMNGATAILHGWGTMHAQGGSDAWVGRVNTTTGQFTGGVRMATPNDEGVNGLAVRNGLQPIIVGGYNGMPSAEGTTLPFAGGGSDGFLWSHQAPTP